MMKPLTILIDGYNVSRNMPGMRPEDGVVLATARENLLAMVKTRFRGTPHRVVVVFDGDGDRETCVALKGMPRGQCIFTQRGASADSAIVRLSSAASADGYDVMVCTNDLEIHQKTASHGAKRTSVGELTQTLNAPDKYTAKRLKHNSYLRREWEGDDDGEPRTHPRKGNPRRAPKKQRGRGEQKW